MRFDAGLRQAYHEVAMPPLARDQTRTMSRHWFSSAGPQVGVAPPDVSAGCQMLRCMC